MTVDLGLSTGERAYYTVCAGFVWLVFDYDGRRIAKRHYTLPAYAL